MNMIFQLSNRFIQVYNTPLAWISAYEKERKLKFYTDRLMEILENPKAEDFDYIYDFDNLIDSIGLIIYTYDVSHCFIHLWKYLT